MQVSIIISGNRELVNAADWKYHQPAVEDSQSHVIVL